MTETRYTHRPRGLYTGAGRAGCADVFCFYCCEPFTPARANQVTCSKPCPVRTSAWDRWIRETRQAAIYGRTGPALPAGGASLAAAVSRYAVQLDLEEVAS